MVIKSVNLETVCGITSTIPDNEYNEVAFAGKSNVGKSSLINALMNRKSLARISSQPGKTQTINFYNVNDANVSGVPLSDMCEMRGHYNHKENTKEIADAVKNSAYEIINKKHATYYGIAMSVKRICEVIMRDEKSILPVSHMIHGVYEIDDVVLSMPVIVGADGIESDIPINLSGEEALKLKESADALKNIIDTLEL